MVHEWDEDVRLMDELFAEALRCDCADQAVKAAKVRGMGRWLFAGGRLLTGRPVDDEGEPVRMPMAIFGSACEAAFIREREASWRRDVVAELAGVCGTDEAERWVSRTVQVAKDEDIWPWPLAGARQ